MYQALNQGRKKRSLLVDHYYPSSTVGMIIKFLGHRSRLTGSSCSWNRGRALPGEAQGGKGRPNSDNRPSGQVLTPAQHRNLRGRQEWSASTGRQMLLFTLPGLQRRPVLPPRSCPRYVRRSLPPHRGSARTSTVSTDDLSDRLYTAKIKDPETGDDSAAMLWGWMSKSASSG